MFETKFFTKQSYHIWKGIIKNKIEDKKVNIGKIMRKGTAVITAAALFTTGGFFAPMAPAHGDVIDSKTFQRFAGASRYETAVDISSKNWFEAYNVVLARGDSFPDALAGAVLANSAVVGGGPLLLTEPNRLRPEVLEEIQRLNANAVFVLGSTTAISKKVEDELKANGLQVFRIQGSDRYETAANISTTAIENSSQAFLASGTAFADALSISSYAASNGTPLLLTHPKRLPPSTLDALQRLGVTEITLIGGETAVGTEVESQLASSGYTVTRLSGSDRFQTNIAIIDALNFNRDKMVVATGLSFPDALAGSVLAARENNPIVLVPKDENALLNSPVASFLNTNRTTTNKSYILGGWGVINYKVENIVRTGMVNPRLSVQFWDGYSNKSSYEKQLSYVPSPLTDYIHILVPNLAGELQTDGSFAYRFSSAETPKYLVSLGQSHGARVVPMVMSSGRAADNMLYDPAKRANFVNSAVKLVEETKADGILVDLEALSDDTQQGLTILMKDIYERLHPKGKLVMISVMSKTSATAQPWYDEYNYRDLAQYADYIQIMSYDKHYRTSAPGPVAPVEWVKQVMAYAVTEIPKEKILMGVPYYGRAWRTSGSGWTSKAFGWAVATQTATQFGAVIDRFYTPGDPAGVPTFKYIDEDGYHRTAFFDDRQSWSSKLDLLDEFSLGGIGGWSMGWINEISAPELYPLLKERMN